MCQISANRVWTETVSDDEQIGKEESVSELGVVLYYYYYYYYCYYYRY